MTYMLQPSFYASRRYTRAITYEIDKNGCHNCNSHRKNKSGYPRIRFGGRLMLMSRYIWEKNLGTIPDGLCVLHSCDNPQCINLKHLHLGTKKNNTDEAIARGRFTPRDLPHVRGESHPESKLTDQAVREIHNSNWKRGEGKRLAKKFGVSISAVSLVRHGKAWKHVKGAK